MGGAGDNAGVGVVVVGQGAHAVYAALRAAALGHRVTLVAANSPFGGGGFAEALLVPSDGNGASPPGFDDATVALWRQHLPRLVETLDAMGLPWDRAQDGTPRRHSVGTGLAAVTAGDALGHQLHRVLVAQLALAQARGAITVLERRVLLGLLREGANVCGITVVDALGSTVEALPAHVVVLAASGTHALCGETALGHGDAPAVMWAAQQAGLTVEGGPTPLLHTAVAQGRPVGRGNAWLGLPVPAASPAGQGLVRALAMGLGNAPRGVAVAGSMLVPPAAAVAMPGALEAWQWAHTCAVTAELTARAVAAPAGPELLADAQRSDTTRVENVASRRGTHPVAQVEQLATTLGRALCGLTVASAAPPHALFQQLQAHLTDVDARGGFDPGVPNPWPVRALVLDAWPALLAAHVPPPAAQPAAPQVDAAQGTP